MATAKRPSTCPPRLGEATPRAPRIASPVRSAALSAANGRTKDALRFLHLPEWPGVELCVGVAVAAPVALQWHDWLELRLFQKGCATFAIDRARHRVGRGSLAVVRPGQFSAIDLAPGERISFLGLAVDLDLVPPAGDGEAAAGELPVVCDDPALRSLIVAVHRVMTGRASAARNRALRDELLAALARRGLGAATTAADAHPPPIRRALAFLREHASREISLDALAHTAGLSKFHFLRRFAGHLGVTPHRYQLLLRVAHARALLRRGVHIADVAFAAGFYDQSHLTRCFHSVVGVPPRRFQRYDSAPARIA